MSALSRGGFDAEDYLVLEGILQRGHNDAYGFGYIALEHFAKNVGI